MRMAFHRRLRRAAAIALASVVFIFLQEGELSAETSLSQNNTVKINGNTAGQGVECPLFQLDTGEMVTLSGEIPPSDGKWALVGHWLNASPCMQGRTFRIISYSR
ncbi:hypothetical protein GB928_025230 [Shinella curvata]|uniref:Uncharacterized protein n=1 Tax=Shinella curvata TaxID=1817964 RepID=A0ABT8XLC0_9HYPH|nr:hypothetical protein [Shinella curvata]MCJ8056660.1 hypothetical protein [Shinella curvata]MDO6124500.1 hypothetical protein [Shinella curvata]